MIVKKLFFENLVTTIDGQIFAFSLSCPLVYIDKNASIHLVTMFLLVLGENFTVNCFH